LTRALHRPTLAWHSQRWLCTRLRRREVLQLLGKLGWHRGTQQRIAERLHVSAATISRDLGRIMPLVEVCAACGHLAPREP
jgi:DNA-binding CsgD family transcriptional regulator